jgi:predicted DCC family thiol-disulfide oxidoreductase YuxK
MATQTAYSYREDPNVPAFDDSRPLVIFDGMCVLCAGGVQWMLARDPEGTSRFAVIQDALPRALYGHYGLDAGAFDTFMVLKDGVPHLKWDGVRAAASTLPQPWRALGAIGRVVPNFIGDGLYDVVQRNRLRWFGTRNACRRPRAHEKWRFLGTS